MKKTILLAALVLILALAGCNSADNDGSAATGAVQKYLQAKIDGDADMLATVLCAANEGNAKREAASFAALDASLEGLLCTFDSAASTVTCDGKITAVYNGENRDLEIPPYSVVQEDGAWKVCGEAS